MSALVTFLDVETYNRVLGLIRERQPDFAPPPDARMLILAAAGTVGTCHGGAGNPDIHVYGVPGNRLKFRCSHNPPHCWDYQTGDPTPC